MCVAKEMLTNANEQVNDNNSSALKMTKSRHCKIYSNEAHKWGARESEFINIYSHKESGVKMSQGCKHRGMQTLYIRCSN